MLIKNIQQCSLLFLPMPCQIGQFYLSSKLCLLPNDILQALAKQTALCNKHSDQAGQPVHIHSGQADHPFTTTLAKLAALIQPLWPSGPPQIQPHWLSGQPYYSHCSPAGRPLCNTYSQSFWPSGPHFSSH
jgi:hypothetical protein